MKVVILAGGFGTRLAELTATIPKPMVEIGGYPVLWHIMKHYATQGHREFIIALGYKGYEIKKYFLDFQKRHGDFTLDLTNDEINWHNDPTEPWKITFVETGLNTMTGGRLKRLSRYLTETFFFTYGDGVSNVDLSALLACHNVGQTMVTVTAINPTSKYGQLTITDNLVSQFSEKPEFSNQWINGGFFVAEPAFLELITGDDTVLEREPLEIASQMRQLRAYRHTGYWHCMDTMRDVTELEDIWSNGKAPWKIW